MRHGCVCGGRLLPVIISALASLCAYIYTCVKKAHASWYWVASTLGQLTTGGEIWDLHPVIWNRSFTATRGIRNTLLLWSFCNHGGRYRCLHKAIDSDPIRTHSTLISTPGNAQPASASSPSRMRSCLKLLWATILFWRVPPCVFFCKV